MNISPKCYVIQLVWSSVWARLSHNNQGKGGESKEGDANWQATVVLKSTIFVGINNWNLWRLYITKNWIGKLHFF